MAATRWVNLDSHVHIYPVYETVSALGHLFRNLTGDGTPGPHFAFLAERHDCRYFDRWFEQPGPEVTHEYDIERVEERGRQIRITSRRDGAAIILAPGFQVVTRENIEVLALACASRIADGDDAVTTISRIIEQNAVPVVPWSPGKWMFKRRPVIENIFHHYAPGEIGFGDTSLRPLGWSIPVLLKQAMSAGYAVVSGSDPLPFKGEEKRLGSFGTRVSVPDIDWPACGLLQAIMKGNIENPVNYGRRSSPLQLALRLYKNHQSKRVEHSHYR